MDKSKVKYYKNKIGIEYIISSDSDKVYPVHNHVSVYNILFIYEGKIRLHSNNESYILEKGMYYIIRPYEVHSIMPESETYSMICICLNKEKLALFEYGYIEETILIDLKKLMNRGCITFKSVNLFLDMIKKIYYEKEREEIDAVIYPIIDKIINNPEYDYDIDFMSKETNISKYYLIRLIKNEIGLTPHKFLIQNRIRKGQAFLNENYTIMDAALNCGFYDESHFIRHFKSIFGITPSEYLKAFRFLE